MEIRHNHPLNEELRMPYTMKIQQNYLTLKARKETVPLPAVV